MYNIIVTIFPINLNLMIMMIDYQGFTVLQYSFIMFMRLSWTITKKKDLGVLIMFMILKFSSYYYLFPSFRVGEPPLGVSDIDIVKTSGTYDYLWLHVIFGISGLLTG